MQVKNLAVSQNVRTFAPSLEDINAMLGSNVVT